MNFFGANEIDLYIIVEACLKGKPENLFSLHTDMYNYMGY